jgi:RNA polymerase sigma factor (sigma-70 family)
VIHVGLFRTLPRPDSFEDVFLERYDDLLRAALAITGGRREAEDLVQDAFVRVLLARPDLASIEHPDAYLRTILRNLHMARLRRKAYRSETPLSIPDFDSAQFAARALSPSQWTQARYDVAAACRYACTRRLTSKTGSVFLLRFVHGFVPSDIARIARLTRDTVDITLLRGRAEVKAYLEQPARALQGLGGGLVPMSIPDAEPDADDDADFLARVREAVFALRHARCIEAEHLRRLYVSTHATSIPAKVLAEIVTCPHCLDRVSRLTQAPPPVERPRDSEPPSQGSRPSPLHIATRDTARRAAAEHLCRAVRAHRPHLLRVLVNGFEVATHEMNGASTRVTQTLSATEPVWLVEVYSEQDVCLASLDVSPPPEAPAEQRATVALADDRRIEVALSFLKQWPTLHLVSEDPAYAALPATPGAEEALLGAPVLEAGVLEAGVPDADVPERERRPDSFASVRTASAPAASPWRLFQRWRGWSPWTPRRPARLAWAVTMGAIAWLLFFTPGTPVSAAERIWRALAAIVVGEPTPVPIPRGGPARQRDIPLPALPKPSGPVSPSSSSAVTADVLRELEVDVLTVLQARQVLSGRRIQVTRTPTSVTVEGLVEGGDSEELVRALRAVPHGAALRVNLTTPADLIEARPAGRSSPSSVRAVALGRDAIPAADDLRRAIVSRDGEPDAPNVPIENVETGMHRIANDGLRHARTAFLEAATLSMLVDRFDAARASEISTTTSGKWHALLAEQADRVTRAVDQMRTLLEPVFLTYDERTALRSQPAPAPLAEDRPGPGGEARRLAEDLRQVEHVTRAALAVAEIAPGTIELRERAFWRRLAATSDRIAALRQQLMAR